jgi:UDP:flavonoid glycosyltransferase YjiC (YdhE family)
MRITLHAAGTRGDVQSAIALGLGLKEAGHDVRLAATVSTNCASRKRPCGDRTGR